MQAKILALKANHTWKDVDLPKDVTPIGYKRVFKIKHQADS